MSSQSSDSDMSNEPRGNTYSGRINVGGNARVVIGNTYHTSPLDDEPILTWLSPLDPWTKHKDSVTEYQPGTLDWYFEHPTFQQWQNGSIKALWCPGPMGAGKTILTSTVIDYLRRHECNSESGIDSGVAFLFCQYLNRDVQTHAACIGSILAQLLEPTIYRRPIPPDIRRAYVTQRRQGPSLDQLLGWLQDAVKETRNIRILLDGLDEFDQERRHSLIRALIFADLPHVHLLVTSRDIPDVKQSLESCTVLHIRATENSLRAYVQSRLSASGVSFLRTLRSDVNRRKEWATLEENIINGVVSKADGMFLLASLQLGLILNSRTISDLTKCLSTLPTSLEAFYDMAWRRVVEQEDYRDVEYAIAILSWVVHARRPLLMEELQHAIAWSFHPDDVEVNLIGKDDILHLCTGLVVAITTTKQTWNHSIEVVLPHGTVRVIALHGAEKDRDNTSADEDVGAERVNLVHYSLQEYFEQHSAEYFPDAHDDITVVCTSNLRQRFMIRGHPRQSEYVYNSSVEDRLNRKLNFQHRYSDQLLISLRTKSFNIGFPLLKYAFDEICAHARLAPAAQLGVLDLLSDDPLLYLTFVYRLDSYWRDYRGSKRLCTVRPDVSMDVEAAKLHVAVANHFTTAIVRILRSGIHPDAERLPDDGSLLQMSIGSSYLTNLLLYHGADPNRANKEGHTALHSAARGSGPQTEDSVSIQEHVAAQEALITAGANVNAIDKSDCTPLMYAAYRGALKLMRSLVAHGASVRWQTSRFFVADVGRQSEGSSALTCAWDQDHLESIKFLVEAGADYTVLQDSGKLVIPGARVEHRKQDDSSLTVFSYLGSPVAREKCKALDHKSFWLETNRVCISLDLNLAASEESQTWMDISSSGPRRASTWT